MSKQRAKNSDTIILENASDLGVLYGRVSSREQDQGFSTDAQLRLLRESAGREKVKVVKEFTDVETAGKIGRPGFGEMLAFLKSRPDIKHLFCEKTDRLSRNLKDRAVLRDLIKEEGLIIRLVKEGVELSKDAHSHAWLVFNIMGALAESYLDNLSEEVKKGQLEKATQGEYPSIAPIGYKNNKETHRIEPQEPQASIIQKLYKLYATGRYSLEQLRKIATDEGLAGRRSKTSVATSEVERILKNPIYCGEFIWKGKLYKGTHIPLITKTLFEAVQEVFARFKKARERRHWFPISGILTCSRCGCAIVGEIHKGKYRYYRCTGSKGKCGQPYVRVETIDAKMLEIVRRVELDEERLAWLKEALLESHADEKAYHEGQMSALRDRYDRIQNRIDGIYLDKLDGVVSEAAWKSKTAEWRAEQNQIQEQLARHQQANQSYLEAGVRILELTKDIGAQYVKGNVSEKRQILRILLSNCTLDGATPSPTYRKPFCWIAEGPLFDEWRGRRGSNPQPTARQAATLTN